MTVRLLEMNGHEVKAAESAEQALEIWKQQGGVFDFLLSDVSLGEGLDGRALATLLKRERPSLIVVLMSGLPTNPIENELDGFRFLQKPFRFDELNAALRPAD